jgi:uncharacterized membrane protein YjfL (UPF0719 family)
MERILQEINRIPLIVMELFLGFALFWLGQLAYQKLFRRMNLNLQLFVRDNPAVAIALVGYYMGIAIALGGTLTQTDSSWQDTLINFASYGALSILLMLAGAWICDFTILRRCDCAREVQEEHNVGAGSVEAGCHIGNGLILSSALGGYGGSLFVGLVCWLLGLGVLILVSIVYPRIAAYDVYGEIAKRNNPAAGVAFAGAIVGVANVIRNAFIPEFENWTVSFSIYGIALGCGLILLAVIRWLADLILVPGVKISDEIAKQETPNLGVGFIEAFTYIVSSFLVAWAF